MGHKTRGRPPKYTQAQILAAKERYVIGDSAEDIARALDCCPRTIRNWANKYGWKAELKMRRSTPEHLERQIAKLSQGNMTETKARKIAMLTNALTRLKKLAPTPKPRPVVAAAVNAKMLEQVLDPAYGLYAYQSAFLTSDARFRCVLKARQIGFSYIIGLAVLLGAAAGRPQLILSASQLQSRIILGYARQHAQRLGLIFDDDSSDVLSFAGVEIRAMPANFRTVQGWPGDVWLDEFAWHIRPDRIWGAVIPSITQMGGRVTVVSTPFVPGNMFWKIAENHKGKFHMFERSIITIHDAIAQGMPLPGGIDELRDLFDSDTWKMFYECQWAEDGSALLSWDLLQKYATADATRLAWEERVWMGVDVGEINDRTAIASIGARKDTADKYRLLDLELHHQVPLPAQHNLIMSVAKRYPQLARVQIDRTGSGSQLATEMGELLPGKAQGIWFSKQAKERLALNILKLFEDGNIVIPNDPDIMAQLHAVKKHVGTSGIRYDAVRDSSGHADGFWAVALAADGLGKGNSGGFSLELI